MANPFMGFFKSPRGTRGGRPEGEVTRSGESALGVRPGSGLTRSGESVLGERPDALAFALFLAIVAIAFHPSYSFSLWQVAAGALQTEPVEALPRGIAAASVPRLRPEGSALGVRPEGSPLGGSLELRALGERVTGRTAVPTADRKAEAARVEALVSYISRRYQVASEATRHLVETANRAGNQLGLDPVLILAVMAVESRFNPFAESGAGAKGLMQVIPKYHLEKFAPLGGKDAVLDPQINILVGALVLREYLNRSGSLEGALQMYNGASSDETSTYANKVFAEQRRLQQQLAGLRRI